MMVDRYVIEDPNSVPAIALAESSLIEDYLEGVLDERDIAQFHRNFLVSADRREQFDETRALKAYALRTASASIRSEPRSRAVPSGARPLHPVFRPRAVLAAIALLALAGAASWLVYLSDPGRPLEREYAELNRVDFSDQSRLHEFSTIELAPGVYRGRGTGNRLSQDTLTGSVLFLLPLPYETGVDSRFDTELIRDGGPVISIRDLPLYSNDGYREIRVLFPRSALEKGSFQIRVNEEGLQTSAVIYSFTVE